MQIIVDTAEQTPWKFSAEVEVVKSSLNTGDYSLVGHQACGICVERKSLPDLVKSTISDWQRFARVLRRMASFDVALVVVESSPSALFAKQYSGDANPDSVRGKINKMLLDFGVATMFLENREIAAEWVESLFRQYVEKR